MNKAIFLVFFLLLGNLTRMAAADAPPSAAPWPAEKAKAWGQKSPWLVGCNFIPSSAINELEMWQADTFDLVTIDRELGWAEQLGFNSVRVFLHNIPWDQNPADFLNRIDKFLDAAHKHRIGATLVLFDSCWDPFPKPAKQRAPQLGLHNSGWVQCPGAELLAQPERWGQLQSYVGGVVGHFKDDPRIDMWDVYNEPDNTNDSSYGANNLKQEPAGKIESTRALLQKVFAWAREAGATQPLTSAVWQGDWSDPAKLSPMARLQLDSSDIISFHVYADLPHTQKRVESLLRYGRPLICTEYMARPAGSTFEAVLPYFKEQKIAAYNWGFVAGKTNTIYPWDSWQHPYASPPKIWFHDIFSGDGAPFDQKEVDLIKRTTGASK